jgi:DNA-binding MarR family transcriptional regulator
LSLADTSSTRESAEDEIVLGVLDAVERDPSITQRSVARELGIALGLANAYLKRCARKGLIKVSEASPRRYAYYLTPQGFAEKSRLTASYLAHSLSFFRRARTQCGALFAEAVAKNQTRLVLAGTGDLTEIASLIAREYPVEIVGIVGGHADVAKLRAEIEPLGRIEGCIVTSLLDARNVFIAATEVFGADRVHVPALLRVRPREPIVAVVQGTAP